MEKERKAGVLFVHGLQGSPRQFDFLIRALPKGTPYRTLLLPGHGGSVKQFRKSDRKAWMQTVRQAAFELGQSCGRVIFVGHSIGCLLGILAAVRDELPFDKMLLIACPLKIRLTMRYLREALIAFSRRPTDDPAILAIRNASSVAARTPVQYLFCARPYLETLRLIREVNRIPHKPLLRATAAFPAHDEIVSPKCWDAARLTWRFAPVPLPGSTHQYFPPQDQQTLQSILQAMIEQ